MHIEESAQLLQQLDILDHIEQLQHFFSREKSVIMQGDHHRHLEYIHALAPYDFKAPVKVAPFDTMIRHLQRMGVLRFEQIFELLKVVRYFRVMQKIEFDALLQPFFQDVIFPEELLEIDTYFDVEGNFNDALDETLVRYNRQLVEYKQKNSDLMRSFLHSKKLKEILVDFQVHLYNEHECLLVRSGYAKVIDATVIGRSSGGYFYILPTQTSNNLQRIAQLNSEKESIYYTYAKRFSKQLKERLGFITFIDKRFDQFDHYQARHFFAKMNNLQFVGAVKESVVLLHEFLHPALPRGKRVSLNFTSQVLLITGVNAGGKTMLLKSMLSAVWMAKYLIPMSIHASHSKIGSFRQIVTIVEDPQNVKNDISTFAGRMQQFSKLFSLNHALIGVDEVELGTDSDEAAALFKVLLEALIAKGHKLVITTHHKRLAALMADNEAVALCAALYDEKNRRPTYTYLEGMIGKSYAFETALRYGISSQLVNKAKQQYGENYEQLSELIERGSALQRELKHKIEEHDAAIEALRRDKQLQAERYAQKCSEQDRSLSMLKQQYDDAISLAKEAAKQRSESAIHKAMNIAHASLPEPKKRSEKKEEAIDFEVGMSVKYNNSKGVIESIKGKTAYVNVNGMRLRAKLSALQPTVIAKKKATVSLSVQRHSRSGLKLDLHGLRAEEATERLDQFLSNALIDGWDEVIVYHGIGTGKLAYAVKEFLKVHPKVKKFEDAPPNMGGFGAKIVTL